MESRFSAPVKKATEIYTEEYLSKTKSFPIENLLVNKFIGIIGSFGSGNIGDEAAWISIQSYLEAQDPSYKYRVKVLQWGHPNLISNYHAISMCLMDDFDIDYINTAFEALIITGGGIINPSVGLIHNNNFKSLLEKTTVPIYCVSIDVNEGNYTEPQKELIKMLIDKSVLFSVRGQYSYDNLLKLGYKSAITPDVVTVMPFYPEMSLCKDTTNYENLLTLASNDFGDDRMKFANSLGNNLRKVIPNILAVPFEPSLNDILQTQVLNHDTQFKLSSAIEMQTIITYKTKFMVAGRLHACVMCANAGVPFFAINYHPKIKSFCDSINYPYYYPKEPIQKDVFGYGYDLSKIDIPTLCNEINNFYKSPVKPVIAQNCKAILDNVYADILKRRC
jgi:hypothetical protein